MLRDANESTAQLGGLHQPSAQPGLPGESALAMHGMIRTKTF
jgi:hypothetical protein